MQPQLGWTFIFFGLLFLITGLCFVLAPSIPWLGRMPGDIRIEREGFQFYFPVVTCLLLSVLLSAAMWFWQWLSR